MIKPEVLDALVASGCTAEQIAAAVKAAQTKAPREKNRNTSDAIRAELLAVVNDEYADALIAHRKALRKPLTLDAARRLVNKLTACPNAYEAIDAMIANGWQGIDASWLSRPTTGKQRQPSNVDMFEQAIWMAEEQENANRNRKADPSPPPQLRLISGER